MAASLMEIVGGLNRDSFVSLLSNLIGESKYVQNNPPELIPEEDRVPKHVLDVLLPYSTTSGGGPLIVNHVTYVQGRGNLIIEYPGTVHGKILSFVGCHMDVVTANPDDWDFDPFSMSIDGDELRGRGMTNCLGNVALVTQPTNSLACIGTGGMLAWNLQATGKLFHSGLAHKAINALELAMEAVKEIQLRFYKDFPPHPKEQIYGFATPSTIKPAQWSYPGGGVNQIPGECTISGDVR